MSPNTRIPRFVPIILAVLGCIDLVRGAMHSIFLDYAAREIAGLDLTNATAIDQLQIMAVFGMSNFVSGAALILIALVHRGAALAMLGVIPLAYAIGTICFRSYSAGLIASQANWGGTNLMEPYLAVSVLAFVAGLVIMQRNRT